MALHTDSNELKLFWHWGPVTSLTLTLIVTLTTWRWWPQESNYTNSAYFALYMLLNLLALYHFVMSVLVGPGLLPLKWHPHHYKESKLMQFCTRCEGYKAPRSHHCHRCDRCIMKMDHHCPWINRCVGWANQAYFVYFLFFYMLSNFHSAVVIACGGYRFFLISKKIASLHYRGSLLTILAANFFSLCMAVISFSIACGIVVCTLKVLYIQLTAIVKNMTDIENWIVKKAEVRHHRNKLKPFVFPYNLGWYSNLGQVFNIESQQRGRGIEFPVIQGCDQYTLTREQLAQKVEKRNRTRTYKCIFPATGSWIPIWPYGLIVTLHMPCTDDPRIKLRRNDIIKVTRIRKYWLFGERVVIGRDRRKGPIRGWFPACCAVDITNSKDIFEAEDSFSEIGDNEYRDVKYLKEGKINVD